MPRWKRRKIQKRNRALRRWAYVDKRHVEAFLRRLDMTPQELIEGVVAMIQTTQPERPDDEV